MKSYYALGILIPVTWIGLASLSLISNDTRIINSFDYNVWNMMSIDAQTPLAQSDINSTDQFCLNVAFESTYTADNFTYTWEFFDHTTSLGIEAGSVASFTFPASGTYEVKLTVSDNDNPINTSTSTEFVTVNDCRDVMLDCGCPNGYEVIAAPYTEVRLSGLIDIGYLPANILSGSCLAVAPYVDLIVDVDYTFTEMDIYMNPGSGIEVRPTPEGGVSRPRLEITWLNFTSGIQGCEQMWKGITVSNAELNIIQAQIADAQYAIRAKNKAEVGAFRSIFKRNYVSLYSDISPGNEFKLSGFWGNQVFGDVGLLPAYEEQTPAPGLLPYAAVEIKNGVAPKLIGSGDGSFYRNEFTNLANGIVTENTALVVRNTLFRDMKSSSPAGTALYPYRGYGIRHVGGVGDPLIQRGLGNDESSDLSFEDVYRAIWVEGTMVDVSENHTFNARYGVHVQMAQNRDVKIVDNLIKKASFYGIGLFHNAPFNVLDVQRNVITFDGTHLYGGIYVEDTGGDYNGAAIRFNTITITDGGRGIRLLGVGNIEISNNTLDLNDINDNASGIYIRECEDLLIRENFIDGPGPFSDAVGISASDCHDCKIDCNTMKELEHGAFLGGVFSSGSIYNPERVFTSNTFDPGNLGMRWGLWYNNTLLISIQNDAGNIWKINTELPKDGYYGAGAAYNITTFNYNWLPYRRFDVQNATSNIYPPSFAFPSLPMSMWSLTESIWFTVDADGEEEAECVPNGEPTPMVPPKDIHWFIARGLLDFEKYTDAILWYGQLHLYDIMDHNPGWGDSILDSFYMAQSNTLLRDYYLMSENIDQLYKTSEIELSLQKDKEESFVLLIEDILLLDSLIIDGDTTLIENRDSLLSEAGDMSLFMDSLELIILEARDALIQELLIDNAALGGTKTYQAYEKIINDIYLRTIAQRSTNFSTSQIDNLHNIATQCRLRDGRAVDYARSLYQLVADSVFVDDCSEIQTLQEPERDIPYLKDRKTFNSGMVKIYPNPTSGEITITGNCDELIVYDYMGKQVLVKQLMKSQINQSVEFAKLPNGIYFVELYLEGNQVYYQKLVITN